MKQHPRLAEIIATLDRRDLVWFGTRGTDAEMLFRLQRPSSVISQVAPISSSRALGVTQDCLETRTRRRVDLDRYDIDYDVSPEAESLKRSLLRKAREKVVLAAYRAAEFLASVDFTNPQVALFAPFHLTQRQLEHKPWVEQKLRECHVQTLPWTFVRDGDLESVKRCLDRGPVVGRTNTGAGGYGVFLLRDMDDFTERVAEHFDGFIGLSPYLAGAIPLNVNGCVYTKGDPVAFAVSYQIIGARGCTWRRFGYCGNDYHAAGRLPRDILDSVEAITLQVGRWLRRFDYRGVFGLDFLLHDGDVLVVELNPRFQGSTHLCGLLCQALEWTDPYAEHIAAYLDLPAPSMPSCAEQAEAIRSATGHSPVAQVVHHNTNPQSVRVRSHRLEEAPSAVSFDCLPAPDVFVDPEAILFKSLHNHAVTEDGYGLCDEPTALQRLLDIGF